MRRREEIWNKYNNNPNFRLYDVYHWEAHPNTQHPEPTTLEQRVSHYEDYLALFPNVVWPGLVEEPVTNPLSEMFGLFQDYWGDQTFLVVIDTEGKIAYQNSFPAGIMDITSIYDDIDALLPSLVPETSTQFNASIISNNEMDIIKSGNMITFNFTATLQSKVSILTVSGKVIDSKEISGNTFTIDKSNLAAGNYLIKIKTRNKTYKKSFIIN